jgi:hypothetical protein
VPLDRFVDDMTTIAGAIFDEHDLETLVLAGQTVEEADRRESGGAHFADHVHYHLRTIAKRRRQYAEARR